MVPRIIPEISLVGPELMEMCFKSNSLVDPFQFLKVSSMSPLSLWFGSKSENRVSYLKHPGRDYFPDRPLLNLRINSLCELYRLKKINTYLE